MVPLTSATRGRLCCPVLAFESVSVSMHKSITIKDIQGKLCALLPFKGLVPNQTQGWGTAQRGQFEIIPRLIMPRGQ